jgi:hypothetical protein
VGVLPPKRGSVNPKLTQVYEGNHLLHSLVRFDLMSAPGHPETLPPTPMD